MEFPNFRMIEKSLPRKKACLLSTEHLELGRVEKRTLFVKKLSDLVPNAELRKRVWFSELRRKCAAWTMINRGHFLTIVLQHVGKFGVCLSQIVDAARDVAEEDEFVLTTRLTPEDKWHVLNACIF